MFWFTIRKSNVFGDESGRQVWCLVRSGYKSSVWLVAPVSVRSDLWALSHLLRRESKHGEVEPSFNLFEAHSTLYYIRKGHDLKGSLDKNLAQIGVTSKRCISRVLYPSWGQGLTIWLLYVFCLRLPHSLKESWPQRRNWTPPVEHSAQSWVKSNANTSATWSHGSESDAPKKSSTWKPGNSYLVCMSICLQSKSILFRKSHIEWSLSCKKDGFVLRKDLMFLFSWLITFFSRQIPPSQRVFLGHSQQVSGPCIFPALALHKNTARGLGVTITSSHNVTGPTSVQSTRLSPEYRRRWPSESWIS